MGWRTRTAAATAALALACTGSAEAGTYIASDPAGDQVLFHQVLAQTARPLYVATRHPGGSFGSLQAEVPPPGQFFPNATVDDSGGFVARWNSSDPKFQSHQPTSAVAIGAPDGSLGSPTESLDFIGSLASNSRGDSVVAVTARDGTSRYLYRPAGGGFGPPQQFPVSTGGLIGFAVDEDGSVLAVIFGHGDELLQATRPPNGDFGAPTPIAGTPDAFDNVQLGSARNGRAMLVFKDGDALRAMERPPGGTFGPLFDVATGLDAQPFADTILLAGSGAAIVSYGTTGGARYATARDPGGSFTAPRMIERDAGLAVNDRGDAAVAWAEDDYEVRAMYRSAGRELSTARTLAPRRSWPSSAFFLPMIQPGLAIDDSGRATASWERTDGTTVTTTVRDFNASGSEAPVVVDTLPSFTREGPPAACRPAGARVLRSSKAVTVFRGRFDRVYGCLLGRGQPVALGQFADQEPQPARGMGLAGPFVAYAVDYPGRGYAFSRLYVLDLRDDVWGFNRMTDLESSGSAKLLAARVTPAGAVAWITRRRHGVVKRVWQWNRKQSRPRLLDASRRIDASTLRLRGSRLTWRRAGGLHHATLR
jgi:hypothetical protein